MGVIGQLIRKLNDALGATTLLVTTTSRRRCRSSITSISCPTGRSSRKARRRDPRQSSDPFVHQFVNSARPTVRCISITRRRPFEQELMREGLNA